MLLAARCAAKINLYLNVIRRRDDGYHDIETIYQPVSLWDDLEFHEATGGIEIDGDDDSIEWNEENLCYRAARLLFERVGFGGGVRIEVTKRIPAGAGLGGGSGNAAATLLGLNALFQFGLAHEELEKLALELGSDVPFFVLGKPAVGRGRGEILEEIPGLPDCSILVVKPDLTVSTRWAYQNLNLLLTAGQGKVKLMALLDRLKEFPGKDLGTYNSFEGCITLNFPEIAGVLAVLKREGALLYALSGSGAACYAAFGDESRAKEVRRSFTDKGFFTCIVRPVYQAIELLHTN